ncbi:MAG: DUF4145 domain-containing protein [Tabrizicola sp.]|uniref:DUF4145 domain-containing protein n=1 Tax=Tabrizicola sp. TaxID=2005166 RepID=UPI001B749754|nr:hypothetical protein [Tabrizicola sp.]MCC6519027.1 hypothetical protein [Tabrizicola sp.]
MKTLFEKRSAWTYDNGLECIHEYFAFQCKGCDTTFFCRSSANSEDTLQLEDEKGNSFEDLVFRKEYFPTEGRAYFLLEVDPELAQIAPRVSALLAETVRAANSGLNTLSAIGARTTFDSAAEYLKIEPDLPFSDKLEALRKIGHISGKEKGFLEVLIDAGGAAAHRGWMPSDIELMSIIEIITGFIGASILRPNSVKNLSTAIPSRKVSAKVSEANSRLQ